MYDNHDYFVHDNCFLLFSILPNSISVLVVYCCVLVLYYVLCIAAFSDVLGETADIHTGGVDLKFPHHDNEIAQVEVRKKQLKESISCINPSQSLHRPIMNMTSGSHSFSILGTSPSRAARCQSL